MSDCWFLSFFVNVFPLIEADELYHKLANIFTHNTVGAFSECEQIFLGAPEGVKAVK